MLKKSGHPGDSAFSCVCLSVCPCSKRKTAGAIDTKLGRPIVHGRTSRALTLRSKSHDQIFSSTFALALWQIPTCSRVLQRGPTAAVVAAFHKVRWRHFSGVVDRFRNTCVEFLWDFVCQKLLIGPIGLFLTRVI